MDLSESVRRIGVEPYDDYPLRVLLPLPKSKLTADVITYLSEAVPVGETVETYDALRRRLYAATIERVVIENSLRDRCEVLGDCSDAASYKDLAREYRDLIWATLHDQSTLPAKIEADAGLNAVWTLKGKEKVKAVSAWFVEPIDRTVKSSRCRRGSLKEVYEPPATNPPRVLPANCPALLPTSRGSQADRDDPLLQDLKPGHEADDKVIAMVSELEV